MRFQLLPLCNSTQRLSHDYYSCEDPINGEQLAAVRKWAESEAGPQSVRVSSVAVEQERDAADSCTLSVWGEVGAGLDLLEVTD